MGRVAAPWRDYYVTVKMWAPHGSDWHGLAVRRLVRIETVRRPVWLDERQS